MLLHCYLDVFAAGLTIPFIPQEVSSDTAPWRSKGQMKLLTDTLASAGEMMELMVVISLLSNDDDRTFASPSRILGTLLN